MQLTTSHTLAATRGLLRSLLRAKWLVLGATLLLSLSVGTVGASWHVLNTLVLERVPVRSPERLVAVYPVTSIGTSLGIPFETLAAFADRQRALEQVCGLSRLTVRIELSGALQSVSAEAVSGECAEQWQLQPAIGRLLDERDAPRHGQPADVVVLSHELWTRSFDSSAVVIGQRLLVEGRSLEIVGVLPRTYRGLSPDRGVLLMIPLGLGSALTSSIARATWAVGYLRVGSTAEQARVELNGDWREIWDATNVSGPAGSRPVVFAPLKIDGLATGFSELRARYRDAVIGLTILAATLLLLVCAGVASLVSLWSLRRTREVAIHCCLGASQAVIAARALAVGLAMGLAVGVAGMLWTTWLSRWLVLAIWGGPEGSLSPPASLSYLAGVGGIGLIAGTAAWLPTAALHYRSSRWLRLGDGRFDGGHGNWLRQSLLGVQVTATAVLLFCALVMSRDMKAILDTDPGYRASELSWTKLELRPGSPRASDPMLHLRTLQDALRDDARVTDVAFALRFPSLERRVPASRVSRVVQGADADGSDAYFDLVSPGFFAAAEIPVRQGREFSWLDGPEQPAVSVINSALARALFGERDPVGQQIRVGPSPSGRVSTVVGVVGDATLGDPRLVGVPVAYTPLAQQPLFATAPNVVLRSSATDLATVVVDRVAKQGRHYVTRVSSASGYLAGFLRRERSVLSLAVAFAALAMVLTTLTMYALIGHDVLSRRRDTAMRLALGASRRDVLTTLIGARAGVVAAAIAVAVPLSVAAGASMRAMLFLDSSSGAPVVALAAAITLAIGVLALVLPALTLTDQREIARVLSTD